MNTKALVQRLKDEDQDFEWYPTTNEIINTIKSRFESDRESVLDCGAGDGRVLMEITGNSRYAIEKSVPLIQEMPKDVILIGTEFFQSTLIDKPVDVVFCNPPYSEYEAWASKIILEAHAKQVFLVIPTRWKSSQSIKSAIKKRQGMKIKVIGTFDFLKADRAARAEVDILEISLAKKEKWSSRSSLSDPFDLWFDTEFNFQKAKEKDSEEEDRTLKGKLHKAVIGGKGKVPALVDLYNFEMEYLYENFKQISRLDPDLLKELGTSKDSISGALKLRITGLKNRYWQELFDNLEDINKRLTSKSRKAMLNKLTARTNVDFTESNIYGVLIWVIKNANYYYDQQLIEIVEEMVGEANIANYKSNEKVYKFDRWRYREDHSSVSHFGLELRIVLNRYHAIPQAGSFSRYDSPKNLHNDAHAFLNDLVTIANNLNITTPSWTDSYQVGSWSSGKKKNFYINESQNKILMSVRAFINGNLHIKFNQKFIRRLNVEFGRLKGWLKDEYQAAEELNIPVAEAKVAFDSNRKITMTNLVRLTFDSVKPAGDEEIPADSDDPETDPAPKKLSKKAQREAAQVSLPGLEAA